MTEKKNKHHQPNRQRNGRLNTGRSGAIDVIRYSKALLSHMRATRTLYSGPALPVPESIAGA